MKRLEKNDIVLIITVSEEITWISFVEKIVEFKEKIEIYSQDELLIEDPKEPMANDGRPLVIDRHSTMKTNIKILKRNATKEDWEKYKTAYEVL